MPDADGTPVEGLITALVDTGEVAIGATDGEEDGIPVLVPIGVETLAIGMLDDMPGELILMIEPEDELGGRADVRLPVGAGVLLEEPSVPERPPLPGRVKPGIEPVDEELAVGGDVGTEIPFEGDEIGGPRVVPLVEGTGTDEEAGGAIETLEGDERGGTTVVPLVEGTGADEEAGGAVGTLVVGETGGATVVPLPEGAEIGEEARGAVGTLVVGDTENAEVGGLDGGAIVEPLLEGAGADEEERRELALRAPVVNDGEGIMPVPEVVMFKLGVYDVGFTV